MRVYAHGLNSILRGCAPSIAFLDIGSGIGNLAVGLVGYLRGTYDGIEVHKEAVASCRGAITPRHPTFRFHHADVANGAYNPDGRSQAAAYHFPFPDRSFDVIFLASVYTHLLPTDAAHYVHEGRTAAGTRRVLRGELLPP